MSQFLNTYHISIIISILLVIGLYLITFMLYNYEYERIVQEKEKTEILVDSIAERRETRLHIIANAFIGFFQGSQFVTQEEFAVFSKLFTHAIPEDAIPEDAIPEDAIIAVFIITNNTITYTSLNSDLIGRDYDLIFPTRPAIINGISVLSAEFPLNNNGQTLILDVPFNYLVPHTLPNNNYKIEIDSPFNSDIPVIVYTKNNTNENPTSFIFRSMDKDNFVHIQKSTDIFGHKLQDKYKLNMKIWASEYDFKYEQTLLVSVFASSLSIIIVILSIKSTQLKKQAEETVKELAELNSNLNSIVEQKTNEIHKSNEELKKHSKLQTEFINIASHELRTPIQPILNYLELIEKKLIHVDSALPIITAEAKRLQKLANDILDVSRIESKTLVINITKIRINELIRNLLPSFKVILKENVSLLVDIVQSNNLTINADESRISQVLHNLLSNSIKFTDKGTIQIKTNVSDDKSQLDIIISDTGGGIPPEIIPRLFEKFASKRVKETTQHGTGLGLFISKAIVESHGGKIIGYNNDSGGATFVVSIPIKN